MAPGGAVDEDQEQTELGVVVGLAWAWPEWLAFSHQASAAFASAAEEEDQHDAGPCISNEVNWKPFATLYSGRGWMQPQLTPEGVYCHGKRRDSSLGRNREIFDRIVVEQARRRARYSSALAEVSARSVG